MAEIEVEQIGTRRWRAHLVGTSQADYGNTVEEAVGRLVYSTPTMLGLRITHVAALFDAAPEPGSMVSRAQLRRHKPILPPIVAEAATDCQAFAEAWEG